MRTSCFACASPSFASSPNPKKKELEKGERVFLKGSKEIYSGADIASLAKEIDSKFNTKSVITIEFQDLTEQEQKESGLPEAKLLPIPGK